MTDSQKAFEEWIHERYPETDFSEVPSYWELAKYAWKAGIAWHKEQVRETAKKALYSARAMSSHRQGLEIAEACLCELAGEEKLVLGRSNDNQRNA